MLKFNLNYKVAHKIIIVTLYFAINDTAHAQIQFNLVSRQKMSAFSLDEALKDNNGNETAVNQLVGCLEKQLNSQSHQQQSNSAVNTQASDLILSSQVPDTELLLKSYGITRTNGEIKLKKNSVN